MELDLDIDRLTADEVASNTAEVIRHLGVTSRELADSLNTLFYSLRSMRAMSSLIGSVSICTEPQVINENDIEAAASPELEEFLSGFKVIKEQEVY